MKLMWLGHASWRIEKANQILLLDPWLDGNPSFKGHNKAAAIQGATAILITHAHSDHASEAEAIAREFDIPMACIVELGDIWEQGRLQNHWLQQGPSPPPPREERVGVRFFYLLAAFTTAFAVIPNFSYNTSAGALAPNPVIPMKLPSVPM